MAAGAYPLALLRDVKPAFWYIVTLFDFYASSLSEMCGLHRQQHEEADARAGQKRKRREFAARPLQPQLLLSLRWVTHWLVLVSPAALRGGPLPRVPGLHRGEHAAVADEAGATPDFEKWQEWPTQDGAKVLICLSFRCALWTR